MGLKKNDLIFTDLRKYYVCHSSVCHVHLILDLFAVDYPKFSEYFGIDGLRS